ncbi:DUF6318 family protein [Nocardioides sp. AE5]|uniref:DUF6318 family protein n=1 Tax=Nocardioides sp. AE5 TaxID=2962573 RepID=UPI002881C78B|nr:DUF6318 family protein [Nocardioides sp. AE5]MDT0203274.1 DUF6318 family protein [Nocardioides sp. AE5]
MAYVPALVLAGCGDGEPAGEPMEMSPSPSPSASGSPSASESLGVEELPASEVEPEEFVRAWVDAYGQASVTGDTSRVRSMSAKECLTCASMLDAVEELYEGVGMITVAGPPAEVVSVESVESMPSGETRVTITVRFNAGENQSDAGSESEEFSTSSHTWDVFLEENGAWRLSEIGI